MSAPDATAAHHASFDEKCGPATSTGCDELADRPLGWSKYPSTYSVPEPQASTSRMACIAPARKRPLSRITARRSIAYCTIVKLNQAQPCPAHGAGNCTAVPAAADVEDPRAAGFGSSARRNDRALPPATPCLPHALIDLRRKPRDHQCAGVGTPRSASGERVGGARAHAVSCWLPPSAGNRRGHWAGEGDSPVLGPASAFREPALT
jgi:hypothetical protein